MNPIATAINTFLLEHHGDYLNPYFVEIGMSKSSFSVDFSIVSKRDNTYLEVCLCYITANIEGLIKDFKVSDVKDLDTIDPEKLWALFREGIGFVDCYIGKEINSPLLEFRYTGERLIAMNDFEVKYAVNEPLKSSEDFINYTLRQYEKHPW